MESITLFLLKTIAVSGLFTLWYYIALRGKRLNQYNRFYLVVAMLLSITIPFLKLRMLYVPSNYITDLAPTAITNEGAVLRDDAVSSSKFAASVMFGFKDLLTITVAIVSIGLFSGLMFKVFRVWRLCRKGHVVSRAGARVVFTEESKAPFTFLNYIFWNRNMAMDDAIGSAIFKHELAHVKQKHTYDKLLLQALTSIFWFNPFFWLMQRELGVVHEFIADEAAVEEGDTQLFSLMLLRSYCSRAMLAPEHHFFASPVKRRLQMLQAGKVRFLLARQALVLPIAAASVFFFSFSVGSNSDPMVSAKPMVIVVDAAHGGVDNGAQYGGYVEKDICLRYAQRLSELAKQYNLQVNLTRDNDRQLPLADRVSLAGKSNPDLFVCLHVGAESEKKNADRGVEMFVSGNSQWAAQSSSYGGAMLGMLAGNGWLKANTNKHEKGCNCGNCTGSVPSVKNGIYILKYVKAPAVVLELGNIYNDAAMQLITNPSQVDVVCHAILQGIVKGAALQEQKVIDPLGVLKQKAPEGCQK